MDYREFAPLPQLATAIDRIWTLEGHAPAPGAPAEPVLPDGRPELILHVGDPFDRIEADGSGSRQASVLYAGQVTSPLVLRPSGRIAVLGVRFHPYGAAAILRHPQHELAGLTLEVDAVSAPLRRALEQVEDSGDLARAAERVQHVLLRHCDPAAIDPRVRFAVRAIESRAGLIPIERLARATGLTRRHLERRFLDSVGLTPKRLARVVRFQRALQLLQGDGSARTGAETAAACGYADQSHFIRDFRQFAGCSPAEHLLRQGELTGFFIDPLSSAQTSPAAGPLRR
jgi:AraC-like DNA-binding protein